MALLSTAGMSPLLAVRLIDKTQARQDALIRKAPDHGRAIKAFEERIGKVRSVEDLLKDHEVYSFVMKAYDLGSQIFGKALVRKALESDIEDRGSLIRRLTDPRMREMYRDMGFTKGGTENPNTADPKWRADMVERYIARQRIDAQWEQNPAVANVLEFRAKAGKVKSWFDVLKDKQMSEFMRTALGVPAASAKIDLDKQVVLLQRRFDIAKLADPGERTKLERQYVIAAEAAVGGAGARSTALQLIQSGQASFAAATINSGSVRGIPKFPYR